ncbi:hypothetical protein JOM56_012685 [Amanita muscaria]
MVKAKKARSDQHHTGVDVSAQDPAASHGAQPEVSRSRHAKTEALNNAVWKQLAPGAGKKRVATSPTQSKTPNGTNTSVSINLPGAPKKRPTVKKSGAGKAQNVPKTSRKEKKMSLS